MIEKRNSEEIEHDDEILAKRMGIGILIALPIIAVGTAMLITPRRGPPDFWIFVHVMLAVLGPFLLLAVIAGTGITVAIKRHRQHPSRSTLVMVVCSVVLLAGMSRLAVHLDLMPGDESPFYSRPWFWFVMAIGLASFLIVTFCWCIPSQKKPN